MSNNILEQDNLENLNEKKHPNDVAEVLSTLEPRDRMLNFYRLPLEEKAVIFSYFEPSIQIELLQSLAKEETAAILNQMAPDDRTDFFIELPDELIKDTVNLLNEQERKVAIKLLGYPEDSIARLMTPNYIRVKKYWTVEHVLQHIKKFGKKAETLNNIYVVDDEFKLLDDIKIGKILMSDPETTVEELCDGSFEALTTTMPEEEAVHYFDKYDRSTLPVVTESGVLVGIVTVDDILEVMQQLHTEDIQKFGGLEALDLSYKDSNLFELYKKRTGWLVILFIGEMFTATAMSYYDDAIMKAVVLALFVPLIISSGGNSGSQAATLIIRAMALNEITLKDWFYVFKKEIVSGVLLGATLGIIGFFRIVIWQVVGFYDYGDKWLLVALTIALSLVGVVLWGTITGSMIPFILKAFKLDPATSSAPFVATMVDVTGLIIYFTIASMILAELLV